MPFVIMMEDSLIFILEKADKSPFWLWPEINNIENS